MEGFTEQCYEDLLFTHAPVAMAYVGRNGKFTAVNEAFCELVGYSEFELASKHFSAITHPNDIEMDRTEAERLLSDPERTGYQMLKRYITKDERVVWCRLCVAALWKDGNFVRYIVHALSLPPAHSYKVEQTTDGVCIRPSVRWMDLVRDHPRESLFVFLITGAAFKAFDLSVIKGIMEIITAWGGK